MECKICSSSAGFQCKCTDCFLCEKCLFSHIESSSVSHPVLEISLIESQNDNICDSCKRNQAKTSCICQDKKKKFCLECIGSHLDINTSHCIEPIEYQSDPREILKYQEKRKKIDYLSFEIKRNLETLQEFKKKLLSSKNIILRSIDKNTDDVKLQINEIKARLNELYKELHVKAVSTAKDDSLAEILINKTLGDSIDKSGKLLHLIDAKMNSENVLKNIKSICRFSLLSTEIKNS